MTSETLNLLGQIAGFVAMALTLVTYLMKTPKALTIVLSAAIFSTALSYAFLGAFDGVAILAVCLLRNFYLLFAHRLPKLDKRVAAAFFCLCYVGVGILTWINATSLLIIVALIINTVMLFIGNNQFLRISILFTSTLVLIYDVIYSAWGCVANEAVAIASSVIGLILYACLKKRETGRP